MPTLPGTESLRSHARRDPEAVVIRDVAIVTVCGALFVGAVLQMIAAANAMHDDSTSMMSMPASGLDMAAGRTFIEMWMVMMAAMMLPSFTPLLLRYGRIAARSGHARSETSTALLALGYFTVWTTLGAAMYPVSVAVAVVAQHLPIGSRAGPLAVGVLILITGLLQLTDWNARHVACCRELSGARTSMAVATTPWRQGLDLGVHCACSSTLPMATLLLTGSMSLTAMWVVTAAITVERLAPDAPRVARIFGAVTIPASLIFVVRTIVQS